VEVYDIETKEWRLIEPMPAPLYNTAVCKYASNTVYLAGTTECKFSGNTLIGFMFTSVFRLQWTETGMLKWAVVEHEVSGNIWFSEGFKMKTQSNVFSNSC